LAKLTKRTASSFDKDMENTMPHLLNAVRAYTTLGEIMGVMKGVFGTYEESTQI